MGVLNEALRKYNHPEIFNTDQGSQYTSHIHTGTLKEKEITISMDGKVRATDNICIERFWRSAKYEKIYLNEYNKVLKHPKPSVSFSNFDDSAFVFELKTHVKYGAFMESDPAAGLYTEIRARIAEKFKEHGIEVPFPQRDIRLIQDTQKVINLNVESFDQSGILPKKENSK